MNIFSIFSRKKKEVEPKEQKCSIAFENVPDNIRDWVEEYQKQKLVRIPSILLPGRNPDYRSNITMSYQEILDMIFTANKSNLVLIMVLKTEDKYYSVSNSAYGVRFLETSIKTIKYDPFAM